MKARNTVLLFVLSFLFINVALSQPHGQGKCQMGKEKIKSQKVSFITDKLDLTVKEAQAFWPVYNEFESKKGEIHDQRRGMMKRCSQGTETMSPKELEDFADSLINHELEAANLAKKYHEEFKKVLTIEKVIEFYKAERHFKHHLLKQIEEHRRCGVK